MSKRRVRRFGEIQERRSAKTRTKRYYPRYALPGVVGDRVRYSPGVGFDTYEAASKWLDSEEQLWQEHVAAGTTDQWLPPKQRVQAARARREQAGVTVHEMCERWLTSGRFKASTVSSHRGKLRTRVYNTALATVPVVDVGRDTVQDWWSEVQERWPETGNSNANAYKRLHTAFQWAVDEGLIDTNPVQIKGAGRVPRSKKRDTPLITREQARVMVESIGERYRVPLLLLLWCGLRLGEMLELRRKDLVGLDGDGDLIVRVRRTVQRITNGDTGKCHMQSFDTPKTNAGNRDIVIPRFVAGRVREHAEKFMGQGPEALVATTAKGTQVWDTFFRNRMLPAKRAAGRMDISPHDCRRFYGTMLVTNGVDLESARRLMGHETVEQLMDYQRSAAEYGKNAADVLDSLVE